MSTSKNFDKICVIVAVLSVIIALVFTNAENFGIEASARDIGYESRIFDKSMVHTIDIVMDNWDSFIETCENEEYSVCTAVIDGEAYSNIGIRAKGNTSLSTVSSMDSDRYSFKIEFDQYDSTKSYYGLDKLCLNNIIQDNTFMKDYLAYSLMENFGVSAPLCSYAYITVNGEDWGLYLAVEGVEESFLSRNYGSDYGELYKPDSMSFGGGKGNGRDFDMENFSKNFEKNEDISDTADRTHKKEFSHRDFGGGFGGMGSSDVKLQYIDDDPESYANIFDSVKTDITDADKERLIQSLKNLSSYENLDSILNTDKVLRYFVVHNFLCNGDSYTGSMIHNYYLYEEGGALEMIPWDYNLAFGTFQGGSAQGQVNSPIDMSLSDRPMANWIFTDGEYTSLYHNLYAEFVATDFSSMISETAEMISDYVEKDPTKFCTYEEFEKGVEAIETFCALRAESVRGQLDGTIPSTEDGQSADSTALVNTSGLTLSDMGTMGGGRGGNMSGMSNFDFSQFGGEMPFAGDFSSSQADGNVPDMGGMTPPQADGNVPDMGDMNGGDNTSDSAQTDGISNEQERHSEKVDFPQMNGSQSQQGTSQTELILLVVSAVVLAAGVAVAAAFKR